MAQEWEVRGGGGFFIQVPFLEPLYHLHHTLYSAQVPLTFPQYPPAYRP